LDTTPPTVPTNLNATAASSSQINLSWMPSTDNVGVTGYMVERCQGAGCSSFVQIATHSGTSYTDTGLAASTSFSYRVRATDAANNLSPYSNTASAMTAAALDTSPPTVPTNLNATAASSSQINLSWMPSTDNVGVSGYLIERCQGAGCSSFVQIATHSGTSYTDTGLVASTTYSYRVRATDLSNNLSAYSNVATVTTNNPDTGTGSSPIPPSATPQSPNSAVQQPTPYTGGCGMITPNDGRSSKPEQAGDMLLILGLMGFALINRILRLEGFKLLNPIKLNYF
jgi:chitodextrinase